MDNALNRPVTEHPGEGRPVMNLADHEVRALRNELAPPTQKVEIAKK